MGLLHGSSLYNPAAPAGNVTGCRGEDAGKNPHQRSDVCGKHTPGNYGCGCATAGTERKIKTVKIWQSNSLFLEFTYIAQRNKGNTIITG